MLSAGSDVLNHGQLSHQLPSLWGKICHVMSKYKRDGKPPLNVSHIMSSITTFLLGQRWLTGQECDSVKAEFTF